MNFSKIYNPARHTIPSPIEKYMQKIYKKESNVITTKKSVKHKRRQQKRKRTTEQTENSSQMAVVSLFLAITTFKSVCWGIKGIKTVKRYKLPGD